MSNGMSFFSWIRDGVRQSVLLGVSDAVGQLGAPPAEEELHPSVAAFLSEQAVGNGGPARITAGPGGSPLVENALASPLRTSAPKTPVRAMAAFSVGCDSILRERHRELNRCSRIDLGFHGELSADKLGAVFHAS